MFYNSEGLESRPTHVAESQSGALQATDSDEERGKIVCREYMANLSIPTTTPRRPWDFFILSRGPCLPPPEGFSLRRPRSENPAGGILTFGDGAISLCEIPARRRGAELRSSGGVNMWVIRLPPICRCLPGGSRRRRDGAPPMLRRRRTGSLGFKTPTGGGKKQTEREDKRATRNPEGEDKNKIYQKRPTICRAR